MTAGLVDGQAGEIDDDGRERWVNGFACGFCGEWVGPANGFACATGCTYCLAPAGGGDYACDHVVAEWNDSSGVAYPPCNFGTLPTLPADLEDVEWKDHQLLSAFGDLKPLLEAYAGGLCEPPDHLALTGLVLAAARRSMQTHSTNGGVCMATVTSIIYSRRATAVRAAAQALVDRLPEGFARLERMAPREEAGRAGE